MAESRPYSAGVGSNSSVGADSGRPRTEFARFGQTRPGTDQSWGNLDEAWMSLAWLRIRPSLGRCWAAFCQTHGDVDRILPGLGQSRSGADRFGAMPTKPVLISTTSGRNRWTQHSMQYSGATSAVDRRCFRDDCQSISRSISNHSKRSTPLHTLHTPTSDTDASKQRTGSLTARRSGTATTPRARPA